MTDTNNTTYPEITWELCEIISNLETMMKLHCLESDSESDKDAVAEMTSLYGDVLVKDFNNIVKKILKIENFYNDFHQDLEETNN